MPKTLNPQNTFPTSIPNFPISGNNEPIAIEPLENAIQAVLDRSENLHVRLSEAETQGVKRVRTVASLAALSAATGFNNGDVCDVEGYGRYRLYNPSGLTADGLWVLNASGGGRWVHTLRNMRGIGNGLATLDSSQRLAQDVRDTSILTQHIANQAVTSAKLAPGSVVGHLGYTPVNRAGDTMTGVLTVAPNTGQVLSLKGGSSNHAFIGFYARSLFQDIRSGYIGYSSAESNDLSIVNEITTGRVDIVASALRVPSNVMNDSPLNVLGTTGAAQAINAASIRLGSDFNDLNSYGIQPGQILTKGEVFIHAQHFLKAPSTISLAIGDNDTGLHWDGDGRIQMYANNIAVGSWSWGSLDLNIPINTNRGLLTHWALRTNAGNPRWEWGLINNETGSDSGSNLRLTHRGDDGTVYLRLDVRRNPLEFLFYSVVIPAVDNFYTLGNSGLRWSSVWAANGTIQTSDAREKTDVRPTPLGLDFIERLRPVAYRWRVGGYRDEPIIEERQVQVGVDAEGNPIYDIERHAQPNPIPVPGRRLHHGLIAQEVKAVLDELGVEDFGGWILTDPTDPDSQQALRYDQFIAPLIRAVQELSERLRGLEQKTRNNRRNA